MAAVVISSTHISKHISHFRKYLAHVDHMYRVSQNIGPTYFFVIISGSGAHTEEILNLFQQPW